VNGFYADEIEDLHDLVQDAVKLKREQVRDFAFKKFSLRNMTDGYLEQYHRLIRKKSETTRSIV
jgi:hypothetical protein